MKRFRTKFTVCLYLIVICFLALALPGGERGRTGGGPNDSLLGYSCWRELFPEPPLEEPPVREEAPDPGAAGDEKDEEKKSKEKAVKKPPVLLSAILKPPTVYPLPGSSIYTYENLTAELQALKRSYPDLITLGSIGQSVDGRELWSVSLGRGSRRLFIVGACHAREWLTSALLTRMIKAYAAADQSGSSLDGCPVRGVLDQYTLLFVPMQNPDGVTLAQFGLAAFPEEQHARLLAMKPERTDNFTRWKANLNGVDLNRQHSAGSGGWARNRDNVRGTPRKPWFELYPGSSRESEPESRAVAGMIRRGNFDAVLTFHSSGNLFYWYYFQDKSSSNMARDKKIVQALSDYSGYRIYSPNYVDWNCGAHLTAWVVHDLKIPCVTVEIGNFTTGYLKMSDLPEIWSRTKTMPLITAQNLPGFRDSFELLCRVYPENSGRAAGGGRYPYAAAVKVSAVPEQHYAFVNWTENGRILGTEPILSVQVSADCILTATFEPVQYEVDVRISPEKGGVVEGAGSYKYGAEALLSAVPAEGYAFSCWMENGSPLSEDAAEAEYAFIVEGSRALSACFKSITEADEQDEKAAGK